MLVLALAGCASLPLPALPESCDAQTNLFLTADVLADATHSCFPWVDATAGRVARSSAASAVVWSLRTQSGPGLLVSAVHTLGHGWFDPTDGDVAEALIDPGGVHGVPRIFLTDAGGAADELATPLFVFYHPAIPDEENTNGFRDILPVHDFYFGAVDDQKISVDGPVGTADPLRAAPPAVYDPVGLTSAAPTFTSADAGAFVLLVGFPTGAPYGGRQAASVGQVLSDAEAESAITNLAAAGDVEGQIPYTPQVEMLILGHALGGMSGGGVFNREGILVGVIVRASDERDGVQFVRAVRMTYAAGELGDAFDGLSPDERAALAPYLGLEAP